MTAPGYSTFSLFSDWTFMADSREIDFQLLEPARSRTTWILVDQGRSYIPCGLPALRLWKQWPHEALEGGRARIRSDGKIYDVQLVKVEDAAE